MCLPFVLSILLSSIVSLHCLALGPVIQVYINVTGGKDCGECLNATPIVCKSILCAAENITHSDMVEIAIVSEHLNLSTPVEFKNFQYLSVIGWRNPTVYCNDSSAGIAFMGVRNLTLKSLIIKNCGSPRDSTSVVSNKTLALNVAVYILNCTDVLINDVAIVESNGTGLSLYDTNGTVNIENSIFSNNSDKTGDGGGALHIEFTICTPGIVRNCHRQKTRNQYSVYIIRNYTFSNNIAYDQEHNNQFIPPSFSQVIPRAQFSGFCLQHLCSWKLHIWQQLSKWWWKWDVCWTPWFCAEQHNCSQKYIFLKQHMSGFWLSWGRSCACCHVLCKKTRRIPALQGENPQRYWWSTLTNLAIINAISLYNYSEKLIVEQYGSNVVLNALGATQKFLMILPLFCVILAELIKFLKKWQNKRNDYKSLPSLRSESLTKNW